MCSFDPVVAPLHCGLHLSLDACKMLALKCPIPGFNLFFLRFFFVNQCFGLTQLPDLQPYNALIFDMGGDQKWQIHCNALKYPDKYKIKHTHSSTLHCSILKCTKGPFENGPQNSIYTTSTYKPWQVLKNMRKKEKYLKWWTWLSVPLHWSGFTCRYWHPHSCK